MLQNQSDPQLYCNQKNHENQIITAICTRRECEQQSAICSRCMVSFHKLCGDQVIFLEDLPKEFSQMENQNDLINQIFESLIQKLVKLQKQHQLRHNSIREYKEISNLTNLNNVGSLLRTLNVDLEKIISGSELISQFIENYLNPEKPKELSEEQIKEAKEILAQANAHFKSGENEKAIKYYDQALKINPLSSTNWNDKGLALSNLNRYQEAIQCYDQALKISPNDDILWSNKGSALQKQQKYQEAIQCCDQALKINTNNENAWSNKGLSLYKQYKHHEAVQCFDKQISIKPTALGYYNKSFPLQSLNQLQETEVCLMMALQLNQNYEEAKNRLKTIQENQKC